MRKIIIFCLLVLLSFINFTLTHACGGGGHFTIQGLEDRDVIVHATVLEADERGFNAILQVHHYLKGHGGEYLTIMRYPPALEFVASVRDYNTACLYSGGGQEWVVGSTGYFALLSNDNGTFTDNRSLGTSSPHFFVEDGVVNYYSFDIYKDMTPQALSLPPEEFEALLLEYGNRDNPVTPKANDYPLMRFLNITTQSGKRYRLNPDYSLSPLPLETSPLAISNDGSHVVFRLDNNRLGFQYLSLVMKPEERSDSGWLIPQAGNSALFSPDSNFVAVSEDTRLTIYMFDNYVYAGYGQRMGMQVVASQDVRWFTNNAQSILLADRGNFLSE